MIYGGMPTRIAHDGLSSISTGSNVASEGIKKRSKANDDTQPPFTEIYS